MRKSSQKGFTLIELLVVIAIIGVLTAIIVPNVVKYTRSGEKVANEAELRMVEISVAAYMADNKISIVPADVREITPTGDNPILDYVSGTLKHSYTVGESGNVTVIVP